MSIARAEWEPALVGALAGTMDRKAPVVELTVRPEVAFDASSCILCNQCRNVCPIGAITFDGEDRIVRSLCDRCGDCAQVCPSGALTQLSSW